MERRDVLKSIAATALAVDGQPLGAIPRGTPVDRWRAAFPALDQEVNGHPLAYFDTAATALRPRAVIEALSAFDRRDNANPSGSLHTLARRSAAALDRARATVASFIGASDPLEVIFTRGTTESVNLVANAWGRANLRSGDEILIGVAEHASNLLPWRYLAAAAGARVSYFGVNDDGLPDLDDIGNRLSSRTRIVAFSQVSNVLGLVNPAREICARVRAPGRIVVIDGAQSVPHLPVDVGELGCDFLAFSSHKMLGPMGVGVLWGRRALLDEMAPYQLGSNMAHEIGLEDEHLSEGALKFGAGTPNVSGPVGLAAAIDFIQSLGQPAILEHQRDVTRRTLDRLGAIRGLRLLGSKDPAGRVGVFSFTLAGRTPIDVARGLDGAGIAIRAGDLAALPLLRRLGISAAARASCYLYTTPEEVERLGDALERIAGASPGP